jgi:hypothetical protein
MRILKGYNEYVMRNLDRGYTRKDLGVSYVKVGGNLCLCYFNACKVWLLVPLS